ncbi:MAG: Bpu10I family restriction endonuclease [Desulfurobacteriaceae bacterium]
MNFKKFQSFLMNEIKPFLEGIPKGAGHSKNFLAKVDKILRGETVKGWSTPEEIKRFYEAYKRLYNCIQENWIGKEKNEENLREIVNCLNEYKNFIKKHSRFSSQSKFDSSILEEFIFWLFYDEIRRYRTKYKTDKIDGGSIKAYCNIYFSPKSMEDFLNNPFLFQNTKDQDFAIYRTVRLKADDSLEEELKVPVVSIECKTYLDKTMLEGSIATAEKIKLGNPHARFYIVTEQYQVNSDVDIAYTKIDQIFVLRKQFKRRGDEEKPICYDVVWKLYKEVCDYLKSPWADVKTKIEKDGLVL